MDDMKIPRRIVKSAVVVVAAAGIRAFLAPAAMIGAGISAGGQMASSDTAAVVAMMQVDFFSGIGGWLSIAVAVLLCMIWGSLVGRAIKAWAIVPALVVVAMSAPAHAFWNTTNTTEAYGVLPNHTAFWVPGIGDTKANQATMESESFFRENKVPGKFFVIPHTKLNGSAYLGWDYYIPAGRLIVVDRAPFFHEWTKRGRGTDATSDQSFPCHSKDNIEVSAEMSLAASVTEDNAAKFLFFFGVNAPDGNPSDPAVIFTSVYQGKSLAQVMGGWGRGEIQSRVCRHINEHTIEDLALNGNLVLDTIQKEARDFFAGFGITIEYVGWAGGFSYPQEVSAAINTRFAAEHIAPVIAILQAKALIDATSGWDKHLPNSLTIVGGGVENAGILGTIIGGMKAAGQGSEGGTVAPAASPKKQ